MNRRQLNTETPRESRFEDRLLTAILADFDHLTSPDTQPHPARRRRFAAPALIAGLAAAGVATATVVALGQSPARTVRPSATQPGTSPATRPVVRTAAYVVAHLTSALSANSDIVNIIDHAPDSQTGKPVIDEIWSTSLSRTYRITDLSRAGRPVDRLPGDRPRPPDGVDCHPLPVPDLDQDRLPVRLRVGRRAGRPAALHSPGPGRSAARRGEGGEGDADRPGHAWTGSAPST